MLNMSECAGPCSIAIWARIDPCPVHLAFGPQSTPTSPDNTKYEPYAHMPLFIDKDR